MGALAALRRCVCTGVCAREAVAASRQLGAALGGAAHGPGAGSQVWSPFLEGLLVDMTFGGPQVPMFTAYMGLQVCTALSVMSLQELRSILVLCCTGH